MRTRAFYILSLGLLACSSPRVASRTPDTAPALTTIAASPGAVQASGVPQSVTDVLRATSSGITDQLRLVVRDSASWLDVWEQLTSNRRPAPAAPWIDFSDQIVVVTAMGTRRTTGYAVAVDSVVKEWQLLRVYVRSTVPGRGCIVGTGFTSPVHVVRIPRTYPVIFSEAVEQQPECR